MREFSQDADGSASVDVLGKSGQTTDDGRPRSANAPRLDPDGRRRPSGQDGPMRHPPRRSFALAVGLSLVLGMLVVATSSAGTPRARPCPPIAFTPHSGDGLFDIRARAISCHAARSKLRRTRGDPGRLAGWTCRAVRSDEITGAHRYHCTSRISVRRVRITRLIAYTTGN
jgi:hypothetical protein